MTEHRTFARLREVLLDCGLEHGEVVAVLSESTSRRALVDAARLAAADLGGQVFDVVVPTPANPGPVALRSTGASVALTDQPGAVAALAASDLVIDCTVEGLIHAPELPVILGAEAAEGMVQLKDLSSGDQRAVTMAELAGALRRHG